LQYVWPVDSGIGHFDQHLAQTRLRPRPLAELQHLRRAWARYFNGLHHFG
jgi:hypothetical protein